MSIIFIGVPEGKDFKNNIQHTVRSSRKRREKAVAQAHVAGLLLHCNLGQPASKNSGSIYRYLLATIQNQLFFFKEQS